MKLYEKITSKTARIGVLGLGYVGLPLAVEKAKAGFPVVGFDIDEERVDRVNRGENYIGSVASDELKRLVREERLSATSSMVGLSFCDVITVCVPTPLDPFGQPDPSLLESAAHYVAEHARGDILIVVESGVYPGATEELFKPLLEEAGFEVGEDLYLAYSPERVDPNNARTRSKNTPKLVGGCTSECARHARALYETVLGTPVHIVDSPREAEMAKILGNAHRLVNCALANEMALVCDKLDIDVWKVIDAASKSFGFTPFYPGPGVGGRSIPVDPHYLTWKARASGYHTRLVELAGAINDEMPAYVARRLQDLLNGHGRPIDGSRILLCGIAYKGNVSCVRESPALKIWTELEKRGADVLYHDPFCPLVKHNGIYKASIALNASHLESMDAVVITAAHTQKVHYEVILNNAPLVLDTKDVIARHLRLDPPYPQNLERL